MKEECIGNANLSNLIKWAPVKIVTIIGKNNQFITITFTAN